MVALTIGIIQLQMGVLLTTVGDYANGGGAPTAMGYFTKKQVGLLQLLWVKTKQVVDLTTMGRNMHNKIMELAIGIQMKPKNPNPDSFSYQNTYCNW